MATNDNKRKESDNVFAQYIQNKKLKASISKEQDENNQVNSFSMPALINKTKELENPFSRYIQNKQLEASNILNDGDDVLPKNISSINKDSINKLDTENNDKILAKRLEISNIVEYDEDSDEKDDDKKRTIKEFLHFNEEVQSLRTIGLSEYTM